MKKDKENKTLIVLIVLVVIFLIVAAVFLMLNNKKANINSDAKNISSVSTSTIKYGNVNNDGKIDVKDVTTIQKYVAGTTKLTGNNLKAADVNLDGKVTKSDATLVQKYIAQIITKLPIKYGDVNNDGKIKITTNILIIEPRANNSQIDPIILILV